MRAHRNPYRIQRVAAFQAAAIVCLATTAFVGACDFAVPVAGKSCPNGARDCPSTSVQPFYCTGGPAPVCAPGVGGADLAPNVPPLVEPALIIARGGEVVEATFGALDPDSTSDGLRFSLSSEAPANGAITIQSNGRYRFVASSAADVARRATFSVRVEDDAGAATIAVMTSVVISAETADLLTWTGERDSAFLSEQNWSPTAIPQPHHSVFIPLTDTFAPRLSGDAAIYDMFVGPGVPYTLDGLGILGDELFSASAVGTGTLVVLSDPLLAGTVSGLRVEGTGRIEASLRVQENLSLVQGGSLALSEGATLSVGGDLVQLASAPAIEIDDAENGVAEVSIDNALVLLGAGINIGRGRLSLAGDLEAPNAPIRAQEIIFRGKQPQVIVASRMAQLPSVTGVTSSHIVFSSSTSIGGDLDVSGALQPRFSAEVFVYGTLILRDSARLQPSAEGDIFAESCEVAASVVVPDWIHCGVAIDAGPPVTIDAGAFDAGVLDAGAFDAGVFDAGVFDAGAFDAGAFDAGVFDAGVFDAGALDAGAFDAGAFDAGALDAGVFDAGPVEPVDAGPPDAGVTDAGAFDAGAFDAGVFDAGVFDAGAFDGGRVLDGCGSPEGVLRNAVVVVEAGHTRTQQLTADIGTWSVQPTFESVLSGEVGASSTYLLSASGGLTVNAASSEAGGYYEIAIGMITPSGNVVEDCAVIRVVEQDEGFRPVPPPSGAWNWSRDWLVGGPPTEDDLIFIPSGVVDGLTMNLNGTVQNLVVETGANVTLNWGGSRPIATEEIAFGGGVSFAGATWISAQTDLEIASASEIPELVCETSGASVQLRSPVQIGEMAFTDCAFDLGKWSALVDRTATFSSSSSPALVMEEPSARLFVNTFVYSLENPVSPLSDGEITIRQAGTIANRGAPVAVATASHRILLDGRDGPVGLKLTADIGRLELRGESILSMGEIPVSLASLKVSNAQFCLANTLSTPSVAAVRVSGASSDYAFDGAWAVDTCEGDQDVCEDLEFGSQASSCPFTP